ncbi:hypothetical protein GRF29_69g560656 [Pseudopithomyces chartarum]|uniref:Uncharacterized protein n=1 Tax=Pseudopithomyces chartarum TaxID=1892770 RepID=A0AAN6LX29_9PLEO|nr:hypothetical protein GRF29_69g560656 [Pseudopithomyces chartarum]
MAAPTEFIKAPEGAVQTLPVTAANRIPDSEISIELCTEEDALQIASGFYTIFPPEWWAPKEPLHLRPPPDTRLSRLAKRLLPTFSHPGLHWIKAVHLPTRTTMGAACWASPSLPCHNIFRRSAATFYGWGEKMGWSDAEMDDMWAGVDDEKWSAHFAKDDEARESVDATSTPIIVKCELLYLLSSDMAEADSALCTARNAP